jgi:hypothetical protein
VHVPGSTYSVKKYRADQHNEEPDREQHDAEGLSQKSGDKLIRNAIPPFDAGKKGVSAPGGEQAKGGETRFVIVEHTVRRVRSVKRQQPSERNESANRFQVRDAHRA